MGGACSLARKQSAVADEALETAGKTSVVLNLSENQLEEFLECFNAFDKDGASHLGSGHLPCMRID